MELMIGDKLKKLRRNKDLTQEEVAAHIGISYQSTRYKDKILKILNILFDGNESDLIAKIRKKASK